MTVGEQVAPPTTLRPRTLAEARDTLRDSTGSLLFRGAGTKLDWGARGEPIEVVVDTDRMTALVEHSPGDMTAVVQAGMPLMRLQAELASSGQRLAVDPPRERDGATVGGIFVANDAGPIRHRFGTLRDLAIGVTFVLADGTVAQAGGKVVKNVAGFDLVRLLCGSLGTLALVTEVIVRLHPLPETTTTMRLPVDTRAASRLALAILAAPIVPAAVDYADGALFVRVEGRPAGTKAQIDALRRLAAEAEGGQVASGGETLDGQDEHTTWEALTAAHSGEPGETVARAAALPAYLAGVAEALSEAAAQTPVEVELSSHAGVGLHTARLRGGTVEQHAAVIRAWRRSVARMGGSVVLRRRIEGSEALVDPWYDTDGPAPPSLAVMRRVKERLDPQRRCAPGRFIGGI